MNIHTKLLDDCHLLFDLSGCTILLNKNADYCWFVVVPETNKEDFLDMELYEQEVLIKVCSKLNLYIKTRTGFSKTNFAAIGNVIRQMHLHVVGRAEKDPIWPKVVWGNTKECTGYSDEEVKAIRSELQLFLEK